MNKLVYQKDLKQKKGPVPSRSPKELVSKYIEDGDYLAYNKKTRELEPAENFVLGEYLFYDTFLKGYWNPEDPLFGDPEKVLFGRRWKENSPTLQLINKYIEDGDYLAYNKKTRELEPAENFVLGEYLFYDTLTEKYWELLSDQFDDPEKTIFGRKFKKQGELEELAKAA